MDFFYLQRTNELLYTFHNKIAYVMIAIWLLFCLLGIIIKSRNIINKISIALIIFCILQEIFDYANRSTNEFYNNGAGLTLYNDLPLQLCHFAYWFSVFAIFIMVSNRFFNSKQFAFNLAYFFGLSGALLGIITVDLEGIFTYGDILFLDFQHSIIILNVIWLIFAYGLEFPIKGILQSFIFINILAMFVGFMNYIIPDGPNGEFANYMFLCSPPFAGQDINHPFIIGDWPTYILGFELIFFIYGLLIYIPFFLKKKYVKIL